MKNLNFLLILCTMLSSVNLLAQHKSFDLYALNSQKEISPKYRVLSSDSKNKSIRLNEGPGEGFAWIENASFSTGTIAFDLKGKDVLQRSFVGIAFHAQNDSTYEAIYFRPFNFHSKDSIRKIHAVQYICHPKYSWHTLRDTRNGEFEKGISNAPDPNEWFHATVKVTATEVLVFVNDRKEPSLRVTRLASGNQGKVGLWVGDGSGGEFRNLVLASEN